MSNELRLLKAFIDAAGYDIEEIDTHEMIADTRYEGGYKQGAFLHTDYKVTKRKKQARASKEEYTANFESMWAEYPKRAGSNPKPAAYQAYCQRIREGAFVSDILFGVKRYKAYCEATDKLNSEFVLQAATFFGPNKHFLNDWAIPEKVTRLKLPRDNEKLEAFCKANDLPMAYPAETYPDWRRRLEGIIEQRNTNG